MEDNQLRLYHACYHNYRQGNGLLKDECIYRAMKELQWTSNFGQPTRHTVPDSYHELWYVLSQAIPLRQFYGKIAKEYIEAQCAMTHNHEDYLWMACEYANMWATPGYTPQIPTDKMGLRWVRFRQIIQRHDSEDIEVKLLVALLSKKNIGPPQVGYQLDLTFRHFDVSPNDMTMTNCKFDAKTHLWQFSNKVDELKEEDVLMVQAPTYDLIVSHNADKGLLYVGSIANKNLQHIPLNTITIPFFQNKHLEVARHLQDKRYDTGVTYQVMDLELNEYSLSREDSMCGRFFIQVIQSVLGLTPTSVPDLNECVKRHIDPKPIVQLLQNRPEYPSEYVRDGFKRLMNDTNMLWNPYDLKIAMNAVGLEVGVVFYSPNVKAKEPMSKEVMTRLGSFKVYNFDKYYRPRYYDRYVFGVIRHGHWYFCTYGGSMMFTSELLHKLPKDRTEYVSYGREQTITNLIMEKGVLPQIHDSRKKK
jgi:hypothetical protein